MTEAKEKLPEAFCGVKLSDITDEMLKGVVGIYSAVAEIAPAPWREIRRDDLVERLSNTNGADYRFGSKYSMHSKLWVWVADYLYDDEGIGIDRVVKFSLDPNMDFRSEAQKFELQAKEEQFRKASSDFLMQTGFGVPLEQG